ncbi:MAG TPA: thiamine-phosphate kinase [Acidimicrobiales bacterium]|nr:thiamine-phosphate kinase [Acidimicrobiales bacterium]
MRSGVVSCATSSTQARSFACFVGAISGGSAPCFRPILVGLNARHDAVASPKPRRFTHLASEDEMVQSIRGRLGNEFELFGLKDDAGVVLLPGGESLVVSVDSVVEGVHFDLSFCAPSDVGWKALMQALSDLAAMGASPVGALIALGVPGARGDLEERDDRDVDVDVGFEDESGAARIGGGGELALGVTDGVAEASTASGCPVVGGDLSAAGQLVVAVTVLGTVAGGGAPVSRSGARPGDIVLVTGPCGGSAAGLREFRAADPKADARRAYRRPVARLAEGDVARRSGANAMIDVSDGLALDLHRLADASGVGFSLEDVPVASGATFEEALGGGEDYELLLAVAESDLQALEARFDESGLREPIRLGRVVDDPELRVLGTSPLERLGWQHRIG